MSLRRIAIIANPLSGRGSNARRRQELLGLFDFFIQEAKSKGVDVQFELLETTAKGASVATGEAIPGSGSYLARRAAEDGFDVVAAAGGDGTVGEVANGLVGTSTALAVLPMGTGNDFSRAVGLGTDLEAAVRCAVFGEIKWIDLGKGPKGFFINIAGCGFDAVVAREINRGFKMLRGTAAYLAAVIKTLVGFKPVEISIDVDGDVHQQKAMLCAVANARCYGGGMMVAPNASWVDGLLDVVVVGDVSALEFLRAFPRVFKGTHLSHPKVSSWRGKVIKIQSAEPLPVLADGEDLGETPIQFEIHPKCIKFVGP